MALSLDQLNEVESSLLVAIRHAFERDPVKAGSLTATSNAMSALVDS
jgi:hypothetical protein